MKRLERYKLSPVSATYDLLLHCAPYCFSVPHSLEFPTIKIVIKIQQPHGHRTFLFNYDSKRPPHSKSYFPYILPDKYLTFIIL